MSSTCSLDDSERDPWPTERIGATNGSFALTDDGLVTAVRPFAVHRAKKRDFVAELIVRGRADTEVASLEELIGQLRESLVHLAVRHAPGTAALAKAENNEEDRWRLLLYRLRRRVERGEITEEQRRAFLNVWQGGRSRAPTLRRPAVGLSADGALEMSWSFRDLPGRVYTIEISRDGALEWFFRDAASGGKVEGTEEEPCSELPSRAFEVLVGAFADRPTERS